MQASQVKQRIESVSNLLEEIRRLVRLEPEPEGLDEKCYELSKQAAREIGFLDDVLNRFSARVVPYGPNDRRVDVFRKSLTIHDRWDSAILDYAIAELQIVLAKVEQAVEGDWSKEL